jgi:hypothetical protein
MTWVLKTRGAGGLMLADYECPVHGMFEATVYRDANGDPPATFADCPVIVDQDWQLPCVETCEWRPAPVRGRVKLGEMQQGRVCEYPAAEHMLDTRPLADGMPYDEWKAKQNKITRDIRLREVRKAFGR